MNLSTSLGENAQNPITTNLFARKLFVYPCGGGRQSRQAYFTSHEKRSTKYIIFEIKAQPRPHEGAFERERNAEDDGRQDEAVAARPACRVRLLLRRQPLAAPLAVYFSALCSFLLNSAKLCSRRAAASFINPRKNPLVSCSRFYLKCNPDPSSALGRRPVHSAVASFVFGYGTLLPTPFGRANYQQPLERARRYRLLVSAALQNANGSGCATILRAKIIRLQGICIIRLISLLKRERFQAPTRGAAWTLLNLGRAAAGPVLPVLLPQQQHQQRVLQEVLTSSYRNLSLSLLCARIKRRVSVVAKRGLRTVSACCGGASEGLPPRCQRGLVLLILLSTLWRGSDCFHSNVKLGANTVRTKYGLLRGIVVRSSPLVEAYLGIPYASPPVGSLRYMPPITPSVWKNVRNADRFSPVCPQTVPIPPNGPEALLEVPRARLAQLRRLLPLLKNQSEDCLYLNIYVPYENRKSQHTDIERAAKDETSPKLPTVLFIHGESYEWSSGNPYDGSELAAQGNVIVVTINFRLGILGFLKTGGKESAQGNFGLMDLVAGLHWLKENLPAFGGDPHSITILGHGSGAALANILLVSPVASDLLQRAVLVSGSAISPWAIQKNPLFVKRRVAEQTGCHGDMLYDDLAPCLRTKSVAELLEIKIDHPRFLVGFAPFVDGTVISPNTDPIRTLQLPLGSAIVSTSGIEYANFPKRDLMFCLTSVESYLDLSAQDLEFGFNETRRDRILRTFVRNNFHYHLNEIFAVLKNEYTDWEKAIRNPLSSRDATLAFLSDGHTASALVKLGYLHNLRGGRSYFLHFKHKTVEEEYPQRTGSVRGEDVPFWLGLPISPLFPHNYTTQEKQISRLLLRYLANFARSGNPNYTTRLAASTQHDHHQGHSANTITDADAALTGQSGDNKLQDKLKSFASSFQTHTQMKRSPVLNQESDHHPGHLTNLATTAEAREALNLAIIYNQRRTNAMKDKRSSYKRRLRSNGDPSEEINLDHLPFWDAYDVVNQLYLELGNKAEIQSHYRGHKLSMWLSLIPQLHRHSGINDQSMRHHQFADEANSRDLYEGSVRPQLMIKPDDEEDDVIIKMQKPTVPPRMSNVTTKDGASKPVAATTECGVDSTAHVQGVSPVPPPVSTDNHTLLQSHRELATASTGLIGNLEVLRRLSGKQLQSYTTALVATVAVGCFLLVLNVLIFAGIYHQREKRARDNKTKEELQDGDNSKDSSAIKLNTMGQAAIGGGGEEHYGGKSMVLFGEYNCYDEKTAHCKNEKLLVELPLHTTQVLDPSWSCSTSTLDLLKTNPSAADDRSAIVRLTVGQTDTHSSAGINARHLPTFLDDSQSTRSSYGIPLTSTFNQFDYAVQSSDQMSFKAIEDAIRASSEDIVRVPDDDDDIPEPPPPPKSFQQGGSASQQGGGILRQAGSGSLSTSSSKKRVHIQEISV